MMARFFAGDTDAGSAVLDVGDGVPWLFVLFEDSPYRFERVTDGVAFYELEPIFDVETGEMYAQLDFTTCPAAAAAPAPEPECVEYGRLLGTTITSKGGTSAGIAKAMGVEVYQVRPWLSGYRLPTSVQALKLLTSMPRPLNSSEFAILESARCAALEAVARTHQRVDR